MGVKQFHDSQKLHLLSSSKKQTFREMADISVWQLRPTVLSSISGGFTLNYVLASYQDT